MLRAKQHKVFAQTASKGKSSMGWFFGFKLHLIVNHKGQIVDFALTTGQVADNSKDLLNKLLEKISGTLFGDKGYLTTLWNNFLKRTKNNYQSQKEYEKQTNVLRRKALIEKKDL
ncbi:MAG: transposase [Sphingobacteriales bacterium]|nr:transposase [Sphingobacteriales bacterium]